MVKGFKHLETLESGNTSLISFEWGVAAFAVGISLYFSVPFEPNLNVIGGGLITLLLVHRLLPETRDILKVSFLILILVGAGLGRSAWHTKAVESPILPDFERAYSVTGWVKAVSSSGGRQRWEIAVQTIDGLEPGETPRVIRTSAAGQGVIAGDAITIRSVLSAPSGPAVPGGYDPARKAYFDGIGGYGYAISKPEQVELDQLPWFERLQRDLVRVRYGLAQRIIAAAPPETGGLQASLITGIRTYISPEQTEALRAAGLAHILAISGLHMGLMAFGIYSLSAFLLACIVPLSRRMDVRKLAAYAGAAAATSYLIISGASVATQRAYIMVMIVFLAIILDRRALSMRSVALAAAVTLLWHPEALLSAGFQMSFAAVGALITVYRYWDHSRVYKPGVVARVSSAFGSLAVTSFVAGLATSGIAVLQFNRMATYGLAGNLLAMPIFTFWVMPAAIAVFPALMFGQEHIPLWVMGKGLSYVLIISEGVAGLQGAVAHIAAAPSWVVGIYGFAFTALCLGPWYFRLSGLVLMPVCLIIWALTPHPDIRVSESGAVAFWSEGDENILYVSRKRADRYGREQFVRRAGETMPDIQLFKAGYSQCDALVCRVELKNRTISITEYPSEVPEECANADIVILTKRMSGPVARRGCNAVLIDARVLRKSGSQDIYLKPNSVQLKPARTLARAARPWG